MIIYVVITYIKMYVHLYNTIQCTSTHLAATILFLTYFSSIDIEAFNDSLLSSEMAEELECMFKAIKCVILLNPYIIICTYV